ncbi:MAG: hypothetical protein KatS3mg105_4325 [Gemmatales bacterium]|nr:MAG: hypothetical protein KatS3mg105_4325 [Gemmatales bacterium]
MLETDIAADTELGRHAIDAVEKFVQANAAEFYQREDDWLIARSQISGLRQIAVYEPTKVGEFAQHQQKKSEDKLQRTRNEEKRRELEAEIEFWELVRRLCEGKPPKCPWSLIQARDQALPDELREEKQPPGTKLTKEQQAARKEKRERRERWQRQWEREHYAAFFQRFCSHYLYEMSKRTRGE